MKSTKASAEQIKNDRYLRQNPYAFLTDFGCFEAEAASSNQQVRLVRTRSKYKNESTRYTEIEQKARSLQAKIWKSRDRLFPEGIPTDFVNFLNPDLAIRYIGYEYNLSDNLDGCSGKVGNSGIAGIIDRLAKRISISREFSSDVRRFTAAHELGHAVLHEGTRMHRDRPVDGSIPADQPRSQVELEADKFASYFLMPEKLVRDRFCQLFGSQAVFLLTDDTAFALDPSSPDSLLSKCKTTRDLSRILVKTGQYNGRQFFSLAKQFGVSTEAMAIRIEELGLVGVISP